MDSCLMIKIDKKCRCHSLFWKTANFENKRLYGGEKEAEFVVSELGAWSDEQVSR